MKVRYALLEYARSKYATCVEDRYINKFSSLLIVVDCLN